MDNDVTDKSDENPEVETLRDEKRRLYELVERLIASQESEQQHRKTLETELQQMKLSLVEHATAATGADGDDETSNLREGLQDVVKDLGSGLEDRLSSKMDELQARMTALAGGGSDESPQGPINSEEFANATWKMIAPLGEELERVSGMVLGLEKRLDQIAESPESSNLSSELTADLTAELQGLVQEMKQENGKVLSSTQEFLEVERKDAKALLDTRLIEVGKSMQNLLVQQEDMQGQTLTLLRGLVDSHVGRLTAEWASEIAGLKRAVDDLRLEQVSRVDIAPSNIAPAIVPGADKEADSAQAMPSSQDKATAEATRNVVTGDFPAFQRSENDPDPIEETAESDAAGSDGAELDTSDSDTPESQITGPISQDLRREMLAMNARPEVAALPDEDRESEEARASEETLSADDAESADVEDALLTEPADWRTEPDSLEEMIDLTGPDDEKSDDSQGLNRGAHKLSRQHGPAEGAKVTESDRREVDLRAYKDLRLSCEPGEIEDAPAEANSGRTKKSYENAPAEASLTRFVRLIRARKRTTPS
ncbi:hypothetical protein [Pelagibius sp. Alg239-R121]|uniref:hypothetical protein n=1 Tax=Pelagibius sp. Alg239-R121 TaxID=2993448 RepID=UPI0024A6562B|nr:hypothetical protein [Pelagibius sp. Alg239-R121]